MKTDFWALIAVKKSKYGKQEWISSGVKAFKNKPSTGENEIAFKVTIEIPDAYFETPQLSAHIVVPEDSVNKPVITPEVTENLTALLREQLGVQIHLTVGDTVEGETGHD